MTDQAGSTSDASDARADNYCLSQEASIQAHLQIARKAIASGENDLRRAAEHIAEARKQGASQRRIAAAIGKSVSTVNRYLSWHGCDVLLSAKTPQKIEASYTLH